MNTEPSVNTNPFTYRFCRNVGIGLLVLLAVIIISNALFVPYGEMWDDMGGHPEFLNDQFDMDDEGNFVTWVSSFLLMLCSFGCVFLASKRSASYPLAAKLLLVMALGFVFLSMDDVSEVHNYMEDIISGDLDEDDDDDDDCDCYIDETTGLLMPSDDDDEEEIETEESLKEDLLGPVFVAFIAALFALVFMLPLARSARPENRKYLYACLFFLVITALTEVVYHLSGCEEDWCYLLALVFFEESFEFIAIYLFLAFLLFEYFSPEERLASS